MEILEQIKHIKEARITKEELFVINFFKNTKKIKTFWNSDYILYRKNNTNMLFINIKNKKLYLNRGIDFYDFQALNRNLLFKYFSKYVDINLTLDVYQQTTYSGNTYEREYANLIFKCYKKELINKIKHAINRIKKIK